MGKSNQGSGIALNGVELSIQEAIQVLFQQMGGDAGLATDGVDLSHSESIQLLFRQIVGLEDQIKGNANTLEEWMEASRVVLKAQHEKIVELSHRLGEEPPPRMKWGLQSLN